MAFNCRLLQWAFVMTISGVLVPCGWGEVASDSGQLLTVEETIGAVFVRPEEGAPWNLYKHANPEAKKALYDILGNKKLEEYHERALWIMGYIGDAADVENLEHDIRSRYVVVLTSSQRNAMAATFDCLGLMSYRGVKEAESAIKRMATLDYWKESRFQWYPDDILNKQPGFEYECISRVFYGYRLSGKNDIKQMAQAVLDRIPNQEARKYMVHRIDPVRLAKEAGLLRLAEKEPLSPEMRMAASQSYTERAGEIADNAKQGVKLSQDECVFVRNSIKEAQTALGRLETALDDTKPSGRQTPRTGTGRTPAAQAWLERKKSALPTTQPLLCLEGPHGLSPTHEWIYTWPDRQIPLVVPGLTMEGGPPAPRAENWCKPVVFQSKKGGTLRIWVERDLNRNIITPTGFEEWGDWERATFAAREFHGVPAAVASAPNDPNAVYLAIRLDDRLFRIEAQAADVTEAGKLAMEYAEALWPFRNAGAATRQAGGVRGNRISKRDSYDSAPVDLVSPAEPTIRPAGAKAGGNTEIFSKDIGDGAQLVVLRGPDRKPDMMRGLMRPERLAQSTAVFPVWIELRRPKESPLIIWHTVITESNDECGKGFDVLDLWLDPGRRIVLATAEDGVIFLREICLVRHQVLNVTFLNHGWSLVSRITPLSRNEVNAKIGQRADGLLTVEVSDRRVHKKGTVAVSFHEQVKGQWQFKAVRSRQIIPVEEGRK